MVDNVGGGEVGGDEYDLIGRAIAIVGNADGLTGRSGEAGSGTASGGERLSGGLEVGIVHDKHLCFAGGRVGNAKVHNMITSLPNAPPEALSVILLRSSWVRPPLVNVKMTLVSWSNTLADRVSWAVGAEEVDWVDQVLDE